MQHFYDGQIRRYITQVIRLMSNFSYKDGDGALRTIPVMYGDISRQVSHIIRDNSENKLPSVPRMGVYVTNLTMDRTRLADASFISKIHVRERAYDSTNKEYLNTQGKNVTVERLMPTPYTLTVNCDIWSSNTEQKLQILEQICMLFNPSLEIQTTDNYVDWTSLSVVELENINFSSRTIPLGTESEIDVATLSFSMPIFISPPTKVKKLGVITHIITSIFNEKTGNIDLSQSMPELMAYQDDYEKSIKASIKTSADGSIDTSVAARKDTSSVQGTTGTQFDIYVLGQTVSIIDKGVIGGLAWNGYLDVIPNYKAGLSKIQLNREGIDVPVVGTIALNESNPMQILVTWDMDTIPTDTVIVGPQDTRGSVDFIVDPTTFNPSAIKQNGKRVLLLKDIGSTQNVDGADAWKGDSNIDLVASANDIVEWNGTNWQIIFDASSNPDPGDSTFIPTYITNLKTGIQYKWNGTEWILSFEGEYRKGTWKIS